MPDDDWLLPRLGDVRSAVLAIAAVRQVLETSRAPAPRVVCLVKSSRRRSAADDDGALMSLIGAQARLSALLVQVVELQAAQGGSSITADWLLNRIEEAQHDLADLAALDVGVPFDA